jgi:small-conductance mechanosensitive channel
MESIRSALIAVKYWLDWLPDPIVAVLLVALSAGIALVLHKALRKATRRLLEQRYPNLLSLFTQMRGLTRLAVLILALFIAVPVAPIDRDTAALLARLLLMAAIGLIGWAAIESLNIAANIYLRRFRLDVDDNLLARKHNTQVRVLLRTIDVLIVLITIGGVLMTVPAVRQYGYSLFASAGVAGIIVGLAARPVLSNLFAGVQLAMTQPIRIEDVVIIEGEWGTIEEITSTYVVVRIWDLRRLIVPLSYFIEKPFQNWTRDSAALTGVVYFYVDYRAPVGAIRAKLTELVKQSKDWNGKTVALQVTDAKQNVIELRATMSADDAGRTWNLRCEVREKMIDFLQREHPEALPRQRQINLREDGAPAAIAVIAPAQDMPAAKGEKPAARR